MPANDILIRMYNVGFGDCFLVVLPTSAGARKIVIDCGSLKKKSHPIGKIAERLFEDVTDDGGTPRIDILILTHRHKDHMSGFSEKWGDVDIGEIWMPWVESPNDRDADKIRKMQLALALALQRVHARLNLGETVDGILLNALDNDGILDLFHSGFGNGVEPRFFPATKSVVEQIETDLLPGVDVFVMGPPRNPDALKSDEPPSDSGETLFTGGGPPLLTGMAFNDGDDANPRRFRPFSGDWVVDNPVGEEVVPDAVKINEAAEMLERYQLAADALDAEINNTSLVLLFKVGKEYLLFPGDAQWGPWEVILQDEEAVNLLKKVTFLKVSHHASHNGTPASLLRDIIGKKNKRQGKVFAMVSMTPYSQWPSIPHEPILTTLDELQFPYVVSDDLADVDGFKRDAKMCYDLRLPGP